MYLMKRLVDWIKQNPEKFRKYLLISNLIIFATTLASMTALVFAQGEAAAAVGNKFIGAGIAIAGSTLGAGIALSGTASAGLAAIVEKPGLITWLLVLAGLAEGVAIYGLIIAIIILSA